LLAVSEEEKHFIALTPGDPLTGPEAHRSENDKININSILSKINKMK